MVTSANSRMKETPVKVFFSKEVKELNKYQKELYSKSGKLGKMMLEMERISEDEMIDKLKNCKTSQEIEIIVQDIKNEMEHKKWEFAMKLFGGR